MGKYLPNKTKNSSFSPKTRIANCFLSRRTSISLLRSLNVLNVYQINLYQHLNFMHKAHNNVAPLIFNDVFKKPSHNYPTNFSHNNFSLKKCSLDSTKYSISFRVPNFLNGFFNTNENQSSSYDLFPRKVESKLLDRENKVRYF